jgi:hypothetical protein
MLCSLVFILSDVVFRRQTNIPKGARKPSYASLALEVKNTSVDSTKIGHWYTAGSRLAYLDACCKFVSIFSALTLKHVLYSSKHVYLTSHSGVRSQGQDLQGRLL